MRAEYPDASLRLLEAAMACDRGVAQACATMNKELEDRRWFEQHTNACESGSWRSCVLVGDLVRSNVHLQSACDAANAHACRVLGEHAQLGDGMEVDLDRAKAYFVRGCELEDADAALHCAVVGDMLLERKLGYRDPVAAYRAYERSCALKFDYGCAQRAVMLERGDGVARDVTRARAVLKPLCATPATMDANRTACRGYAEALLAGSAADIAEGQRVLDGLCPGPDGTVPSGTAQDPRACLARGKLLSSSTKTKPLAKPLFEYACAQGEPDGCKLAGMKPPA